MSRGFSGAAMVQGQSVTALRRVLIEASALTACGFVLGPITWLRSGAIGLQAAAAAIAACGLAALLAGLAGAALPGQQAVLQRLLLGMLLRMGIPLGFCLVVYAGHVESLIDGGVAFTLLPVYLVMLSVETWLSLPRETSGRSGAGRGL